MTVCQRVSYFTYPPSLWHVSAHGPAAGISNLQTFALLRLTVTSHTQGQAEDVCAAQSGACCAGRGQEQPGGLSLCPPCQEGLPWCWSSISAMLAITKELQELLWWWLGCGDGECVRQGMRLS